MFSSLRCVKKSVFFVKDDFLFKAQQIGKIIDRPGNVPVQESSILLL